MKTKRKPCLIILAVLIVSLLSGCSGSEGMFGAGVAAGTIAQGTLSGASQDLTVLETSLQEQYAKALAEGATQADLDRIELSINRIQQGQQGVKIIDQGLKTDWTDPAAIGGWAGTAIAALLYLLSNKKLTTTTKKYESMKQGQATLDALDPVAGEKLYAAVGEARAVLGIK
jgi:hypothetical protein